MRNFTVIQLGLRKLLNFIHPGKRLVIQSSTYMYFNYLFMEVRNVTSCFQY